MLYRYNAHSKFPKTCHLIVLYCLLSYLISADGESGVINAKFLEGQTVQLEDGSTAFIQAANPKASQNLHPVQLEDGSTAYLTTNLFAGDQIDPNELIQQHHASELPGQRTGVTIVSSLAWYSILIHLSGVTQEVELFTKW